MDGMGERIHLHGVVAPDRSRALFAFAPVDSLYPDPAPRLRFRGLDPERTYRVRPVIVGSAPSGCARRGGGVGRGSPGAGFTGAALEHVGVAAPIVHPDQVVLLEVLRE